MIAEYETILPDKELLKAKLHEFYQLFAPPDDEVAEPKQSKPARRRNKP